MSNKEDLTAQYCKVISDAFGNLVLHSFNEPFRRRCFEAMQAAGSHDFRINVHNKLLETYCPRRSSSTSEPAIVNTASTAAPQSQANSQGATNAASTVCTARSQGLPQRIVNRNSRSTSQALLQVASSSTTAQSQGLPQTIIQGNCFSQSQSILNASGHHTTITSQAKIHGTNTKPIVASTQSKVVNPQLTSDSIDSKEPSSQSSTTKISSSAGSSKSSGSSSGTSNTQSSSSNTQSSAPNTQSSQMKWDSQVYSNSLYDQTEDWDDDCRDLLEDSDSEGEQERKRKKIAKC